MDGTGRYLFQLFETGATAGSGTYSLKVAVKRPKTSTTFARVLTPGSEGRVEFVFWATNGVSVSGAFAGPGVAPGTLRLLGPDGVVPVLSSGKAGVTKFTAELSQGVGLYRVSVAATKPVEMNLGATPPKKSKLFE